MQENGYLFYGDALIRSELHIDPNALSDEAWGFQVVMAKWLISYKVKEMERLFR